MESLTINIKFKDYTSLIIDCNYGIAQEFSEYFSFYAPNYRYMPAFKNHTWDGKIKLFNASKRLLPVGLIGKLVRYCKENGLDVVIDDEVKEKLKGNQFHIDAILDSYNIPFEPYDHQVKAIDYMINKKRGLILSPTSSGKSLNIYATARFNTERGKNTLIIVPTVQLVKQLSEDFADYGWDSESHVHQIYSGKDKEGLKIKIFLENGNVLLFDGNEKLKVINSNIKYIKAKDITNEHELDDKWLSAFNKK